MNGAVLKLKNAVITLTPHRSIFGGRKVPKIFYGIYKTDGMRVEKGDVIVKQPDTSYYPGMNVSLNEVCFSKFIQSFIGCRWELWLIRNGFTL